MAIWQRLHDLVCGEGRQCMPAETDDPLSAALRQEEFEALRLSVGLRLIACLVIAVLLTVELHWPLVLNYYGYIGALAASGYLQLLLRKPALKQPWMDWAFPLFDMTVLVAGIVLPNPLDPNPLPPPMQLGFDTVLDLVLFVVLAGLGQSARVMLFSTLAAVLAWTAGTLYVVAQPGVTFYSFTNNLIDISTADRLTYLLDPWNVRVGEFIPRIVLVGLIGVILTVGVLRSRHLIARQLEAERARRNLSRHFSPHIAETLAQMDEPLGQVMQLDAVVLFADLVSFTQLADELSPQQTVSLLRDVHQRLARAVADNRGTLDKYLGDGIMASFGTPESGPHDASAALLAARSMLQEIEALNRQRRLLRQSPLTLAIGLHYGPLTLGNIGDENRVEYALIGETVNVAHRLEQMTRALNTPICVSQAFVDKLTEETRGDLAAIRDMVALQPQAIRGLRDHMVIWIQQRTAPRVSETGATEAAPTIH